MPPNALSTSRLVAALAFFHLPFQLFDACLQLPDLLLVLGDLL
jgi:hypothetical protein